MAKLIIFFMLCEKSQQQHGEVLVYNRVWRTGSTGMLALLEKLSSRNNFWMRAATEELWDSALHRKVPRIAKNENTSTAARLIGTVLRDAVAAAFEDEGMNSTGLIHGHFTLDATRYIEQVARVRRITIVREPRSRALSEYEYLRLGCPAARRRGECDYEKSRSSETILDCLNSVACRSWLARLCRHQTDAVCGTDDMTSCLSSREEKRLRWLWSNYNFIGNTAQLTQSISYLEQLLPAWFDGASELFDEEQRPNSVPQQDQHSDVINDFMEAACAVDSEFYDSVYKAFPKVSPCQPCGLTVQIDDKTHQLQVFCDPSLWPNQVDTFIANNGLSAGSGSCNATCIREHHMLPQLYSTCLLRT